MQWDKEFITTDNAKIGSELRIRLPNDYNVKDNDESKS